MTIFYLGAAILVTLFAIFALLPVLMKRSETVGSANQVNNPEIVKQRLQELAVEKRESLLTEQEYQQAVLEIKLQLADELTNTSSVTSTPVSKASHIKYTAVSLMAFAAVAAVYWQINNLAEVQQWQKAKKDLPELGQRIVVEPDGTVTRQDLIDFSLGLRTRLNAEQDDAVGWLLLGRVLSSLRDFEGAILAFDKSLNLQPDRPGTLLSLAQTLLVTEDSTDLARAHAILSRLRAEQPDDNNITGLLAVALTRQGETAQAVALWKALKGRLSPTDPLYSTVSEQLTALSGQLPSGGAPGVKVQVSVADALLSKLPETGFLFVFIQDADSGMKMPAAVKKIQFTALADIQAREYTLTVNDAMLPNFNLSNVTNGRLIARISVDENVALQAGELQGELNIHLDQNEQIQTQLVINKEIL